MPAKKPDFVTDYLTNLKNGDPLLYQFFLAEASNRGLYDEQIVQNATRAHVRSREFQDEIMVGNSRFISERKKNLQKFELD